MAKLKDGFYKQTAEAIGSDLYVLLAGGGSKAVSDFATASALGDYVTLTTAQNISGVKTFSGGNLPVKLNSTGNEVGVQFLLNGTAKGWVGHTNTVGTYIYNYSSAKYIGVKDDGTPFYYNGAVRTLLHSGNYNSYTPKLDGTGATGTWGINISGNAATANNANSSTNTRYIQCPDTRSTAFDINSLVASSTGVSFDFKQNTVTGLSYSYAGVMTFRPYETARDWTGGPAHQLAFDGYGLHHRTYDGSGFGSWKTLAYISDVLKNYGTDASRPNGGTFTLPGGANPVSMRSNATSGADIGIFYLSDDNAFVCNSSDNGYLFAAFDTDKTADFSSADNAAFAVLSDHGGVKSKGDLSVGGYLDVSGARIFDGTNAILTLKTKTAGDYAYLAAYNTGGQYGADVVLNSGSAMVLGAGESAAGMYSNNVDSLQSSENLYLTADGSVKIFTNCDTIANRIQVATFSNSGTVGIGTALPAHKLDVRGRIFSLTSDVDGVIIKRQASGSGAFVRYLSDNQDAKGWRVGMLGTQNDFTFEYSTDTFSSTSQKLCILKGGGLVSPGHIIIKSSTSNVMTYDGNVHGALCFENSDSSQNVRFIFTDYDSYRSPAGIKLIGNQGGEWFEVDGSIYGSGFVKNSSSDSYVLLGGGGHKQWATSSTANTLVARDANQYIYATYYNSAISNEDSISIGSVYVRNTTDNWIRRMSYSKFVENMGSSLDSRYVNVDGDTMTGLLTLTSSATHKGVKIGNTYINAIDGDLIFQNNTALRFGGDSWDYNVWAGLKYVHSSKIIYLGLADNSAFTANSAQTEGTVHFAGINHITSSYYNVKVGYVKSHTPSTTGWYTIAQIKGYFNYDVYISGGWNNGMPSTVRANICNINGTTKITQMSGYAGSLCSRIRLGKVSTDTWDVQVYITAQPGAMGQQTCVFTGFSTSTITTYVATALSSTSYSVVNALVFGQISGISITSDNYTSYVNTTNFPGLNSTGTVTSVATGTGLTGGTITTTGTISLATSGVTAGSYGPSSAVSGTHGATMSVPYITVDDYGRVTSISNKTYTAYNTDNNYYPIRSYTSGLQISSYSGSSDCALYVPNATGSQAGVVSTSDQTFAGQKTFSAIRLRSTSTTNYGGYLYFGDASYAYIAELSDDKLTYKASDHIFNGASVLRAAYYIGTVYKPQSTTTISTAYGYGISGVTISQTKPRAGKCTITVTNNSGYSMYLHSPSVSALFIDAGTGSCYEHGFAYIQTGVTFPKSIANGSTFSFSVIYGYVHTEGSWKTGDFTKSNDNGGFTCSLYASLYT